jgi:hypothetical protein
LGDLDYLILRAGGFDELESFERIGRARGCGTDAVRRLEYVVPDMIERGPACGL